MKKIAIAAFSGSLRKKSFNTMLVKAFEKHALKNFSFNFIDIGMLPFINEDLENALPTSVTDLHKSIIDADAILMSTPEYNRSYSPVLKNALDWGSRPEGKNKWSKKPTAVIGCTPYSMGAFGAENHLRQVLMYLDMYVLPQPEFYMSFAKDKFNARGELNDKETIVLIKEFWKVFAVWINKFN
jgi:chromate reductase, NAD(P)H dehydrogenase (quinone)